MTSDGSTICSFGIGPEMRNFATKAYSKPQRIAPRIAPARQSRTRCRSMPSPSCWRMSDRRECQQTDTVSLTSFYHLSPPSARRDAKRSDDSGAGVEGLVGAEKDGEMVHGFPHDPIITKNRAPGFGCAGLVRRLRHLFRGDAFFEE